MYQAEKTDELISLAPVSVSLRDDHQKQKEK